ncbi:acyl-CoA dehydrogenase [Paraburkholderia caffeinilytica]|nr:acyl-CoA dehydrogenase [Paraburkholderia caffeinilytica]CAB3781346.1 hypothetical protein LMG28690_01175 [Paraburkholderia caffeinilytica]
MCDRVADRAVQIHGGAGYVSEYAIERFYRDVRLFRIYEGTTQIQQLAIARNMIRDTDRQYLTEELFAILSKKQSVFIKLHKLVIRT